MVIPETIGDNPKISIIIPCYNHGKYLNETLLSVFNQTYENWEIIIINDGSSDNTREISQKWIKKDNRIKYYYKENGGLSSARNFGLSKCDSEYVQFLDADDLLHPLKFKKSVDVLINTKDRNTIVISDFEMFDDHTKKKFPPFCFLNNININYESILLDWDSTFTIPIHCALFPTFFFQKIRFEELLKAKEDWLMWLEVFKEFRPSVIFINEMLAVYRSSLQSMTMQSELMYKNAMKAYEIIFMSLENDINRKLFFKKVNNHWLKEVLYQQKEVEYMNNSKYFKMRKSVLNIFKKVWSKS